MSGSMRRRIERRVAERERLEASAARDAERAARAEREAKARAEAFAMPVPDPSPRVSNGQGRLVVAALIGAMAGLGIGMPSGRRGDR